MRLSGSQFEKKFGISPDRRRQDRQAHKDWIAARNRKQKEDALDELAVGARQENQINEILSEYGYSIGDFL